jgi:hypothetical protein
MKFSILHPNFFSLLNNRRQGVYICFGIESALSKLQITPRIADKPQLPIFA